MKQTTMKRPLWFAILAIFLWVPSAGAASVVVVESKSVFSSATGVTIGISVINEVSLKLIELPLVIREVDPGSYISGPALIARRTPDGRLASVLMGINIINTYSMPDGACKMGMPGGFGTIAAPDFVSPDAVLFSVGKLLPSEAPLPPGADHAGGALQMVVNVTGTPGNFEIDTTCTNPAHHALLVEDGTDTNTPFSFNRGIITIVSGSGHQASFFAYPTSGDPPLTVFFTGGADTSVDHWIWSFGDGDSAFIQHPVHVYPDTGSFTVTLQAVIGAETFSTTRPACIRVNALRASFTGTPRAGVRPFDVNFMDLSAGSPTAWSWDFGDGGSAAIPNPLHTYVDTGCFAVSLKVSNAANSDSVRLLNYIRADTVARPDLDVNLFGSVRPRPGFDKEYCIRVRNIGSGPTFGDTLRFIKPPQATYVYSTPLGGVVGDTVKWTLGLLSPGDTVLDLQVWVNVPVSISVGTPLLASAAIDSASGEIMCVNNHRPDSELVVASVDPNDKVVQPSGSGPHKTIQRIEPLSYTIYFENKKEATAEAIYVLIVDTLDPDLDWRTLQIGPTSGDTVLSFHFDPYSGEMRWFFDSLMLVPNVTPPEGEGFVSYTISPKAGLPNGTIISNRAHIRFDYNGWLAAPGSGPVELTLITSCDCAAHGDVKADGVSDVFDVVALIDYAFAGSAQPPIDASCPHEDRGDVNCDGVDDVFDVIGLIEYVFSGGQAPCDPCACDPYPASCP
jgi:PKD repeat protein